MILASRGVKLDTDVVVIPDVDWVERFAPNEVLVPKDRFDFEPVDSDMLIVCPLGATTRSGIFCAKAMPT